MTPPNLPNPQLDLTPQEIETIRMNCPSLQEHLPPSPRLLACLQHWRQQSEAEAKRRTTMPDDGGGT